MELVFNKMSLQPPYSLRCLLSILMAIHKSQQPCKLFVTMNSRHAHALNLSRRSLCATAALAGFTLLAACGQTPDDSPADDARQLLVGTWLREYDQDGAHIRRLLVLEPEGKFSEEAKVVDATGAVTQHLHAGLWLYDGMNLKRHYTSFDGKRPHSPTLPYATFQVRFESSQEFVGTDNLRKREVRYRRVEDGAAL